MTRRKESAFFAVDTHTGQVQHPADNNTRILISSRALGWRGLAAESGLSTNFSTDGMAISGHCVVLNLSDQPLQMEIKNGTRGFIRERVEPQGIRISPALFEVKLRKPRPDHWGAVVIDAAVVDALMGRPVEPRAEIIGLDAGLYSASMALLQEADAGGPSGQLFVDGLMIAIASQLARRAGVDPRLPMENLGPKRLKLVVSFIEDAIGDSLTIETLARVAGLSPAHFAREFKRQMRETPHQFVMRRRLERARQLLLQGLRLADIARLCGFADQAHLTRRFRQHFGAPPGTFARDKAGD